MDGSPCTSIENNVLKTPNNHVAPASVPKLCLTPCELCKSPASLYCSADEARLCFDCDARIHSANFLVARHPRSILCPFCGSSSGSASLGPRFKPPPFHLRICLTCRSNLNHANAEIVTISIPANAFHLQNCCPWDHDEESRVCSSASSTENSHSRGYGFGEDDDDAEQEASSSHRSSTIASNLRSSNIASTSVSTIATEQNKKRMIPISFQCWWNEGVGDSEDDDSVRHSLECSSQEVSTIIKEDTDLGFNSKTSKRQRV